jgi:hypothetical protein
VGVAGLGHVGPSCPEIIVDTCLTESATGYAASETVDGGAAADRAAALSLTAPFPQDSAELESGPTRNRYPATTHHAALRSCEMKTPDASGVPHAR